jgi:nicotinamide mononucleotide transporter
MRIGRLAYAAAIAASVLFVAATMLHRLPFDVTEALGFVTGGWAVWLTVKENIWNWPIGIANSGFYLVVFLQSRLYADMTLQVIYIVLGALGWYWWLRGIDGRSRLRVSRIGPTHALVLGAMLVAGSYGMMLFLRSVDDAAPFWDAATTTLSLIAQYMLTRKLFENWLVWITADLIYIGLYLSRHLVLTALLYAVFLAMCTAGLVQWRRSMATSERLHGPHLSEKAMAGA